MALNVSQLILSFGDSPCQVRPKYRMGKAGQKLEGERERLQSAKHPFSFLGSERSASSDAKSQPQEITPSQR